MGKTAAQRAIDRVKAALEHACLALSRADYIAVLSDLRDEMGVRLDAMDNGIEDEEA